MLRFLRDQTIGEKAALNGILVYNFTLSILFIITLVIIISPQQVPQILHNITQYYTILHNITQYYTIHNITQYYTTLHNITQYYTILHNKLSNITQ